LFKYSGINNVLQVGRYKSGLMKRHCEDVQLTVAMVVTPLIYE